MIKKSLSSVHLQDYKNYLHNYPFMLLFLLSRNKKLYFLGYSLRGFYKNTITIINVDSFHPLQLAMIPFNRSPTKRFLGCSQSLAFHSCGEYHEGHCFASVHVTVGP